MAEKTYTVYIYPVVKVKVTGIVAENQEAAIKLAEESVDLETLLQHPEFEYAEDIDCFLVDEESDTEYNQSRWYNKHGKPLRRTP